MKLSTVALLCATASAYPLRDLDGATPSVSSTDNGAPQAQLETAPRDSSSPLSASVNHYIARLRRGASALFAEDSPDTEPVPPESAYTSESTHDDTHHKALMASFSKLDQRYKELADKAHRNTRRIVYSPDPETEPQSAFHHKPYHKILMESFSKLDLRFKELANKAHPEKRAVSTFDPEIKSKSNLRGVIERNGPECVALVIFILAPITFLFFCAIGLLFKRLTQERIPQCGHGRIRLHGSEREALTSSDREYEAITSEKSRWQTREQC